jgi:transcriptional regulator with PAS, ATPase and Fis domain
MDEEVEMSDCIERVRYMDVACLIGDMRTARSASGLGIPLTLIESGSDAVAEAMDKVVMIARSRMFRKASDLRLGAILNTVREGIITVDRAGLVTHVNSTAHDILGADTLVGMPADAVLPRKYIVRAMADRHEAFVKLLELKGHRTTLDVTPIVSCDSVEGAVDVLQEVDKIQNMEKKVRRQLSAGGLIARYSQLVFVTQ